MIKKKSKNIARKARHERVRKVVNGTSDTPRLCVFRSNNSIYAQLIDDKSGTTLASASSKGRNIESAAKVGTEIAKKAKEKKIENIVFDRSGYLYHGRVKALADAARESGLKF